MELMGQVNAYVCEQCGQHFITINACDGTTPFMTKCRAVGGCRQGMARSHLYNVPPGRIPQWEWYRPGDAELAKLDDVTQEHVRKGGLILRKLDMASGLEKYGFRLRRG